MGTNRPSVRRTSAAATSFSVGSPGTFTVTSTGSPTPAITVGGALPAGVTFVDNAGAKTVYVDGVAVALSRSMP